MERGHAIGGRAGLGGATQADHQVGAHRVGGGGPLRIRRCPDSGAGQDDLCVFVSTEGEVAIYQGANPADASDWALIGRYDIGEPVGKNATLRAGGDLVIATKDGMVPLSQAMQKDPAALSLASVSKRIEPYWVAEMAALIGSAQVVKWTDRNLALVTVPGRAKVLVVHLQTGAWGVAQGWGASCAAVYDGQAYLGIGNKVFSADETGSDDGADFVANLCGAFSDYGAPANVKMAQMLRATFLTRNDFTVRLYTNENFTVEFPNAPAAIYPTETSDSDQPAGTVMKWDAVSGLAPYLAPVVQVVSGGPVKIDCELIRMDMTVEIGGVAV